VTNVDNIPAEEVAKIYAKATTARRFIKINLDPNSVEHAIYQEQLKKLPKSKEMSLSGSHVEVNLGNEDYSHLTTWHPFQLNYPTLARAMTLGEYRRLYNTPNQEESDAKGFAVRYPNMPPANPPCFVLAEEFNGNYHLLGSSIMQIEFDPNEPDRNGTIEKIKNASLSGTAGPRGIVAGLQMLDEASFGVHQWGAKLDIAKTYPGFLNEIPMTIYKSTPLENGMALGVIETLSDVNGKLTFSDALQALKFGYRVQRSGWSVGCTNDGKNFLFKTKLLSQ
jgi:hypothetical protein